MVVNLPVGFRYSEFVLSIQNEKSPEAEGAQHKGMQLGKITYNSGLRLHDATKRNNVVVKVSVRFPYFVFVLSTSNEK